MADIPITGVASNYAVPGTYLETVFGQGPSTAGADVREIIVTAPMSSAGAWTANTRYRIKNEQDAIDGAGPGSPLHRALRMVLKSNRNVKLFALPYAESSGSAVAADGYVEFSGTATASGVAEVTVAGESCQAAIAKNDTASAIATAMAASINAKTWLPVTASVNSATVTLTAKVAGISQGDGTTGAIRFRVAVSSGIGITATVSGAALGLGAGTAGVEGSTTEAANLQTALATLDNDRKYYIVSTVWDATSLGHLKTHVSTKSDPIPGLRSVAITAFTGSLAAGQTLATALNYERMQVVWQPSSEHDPAELAGNVAGVRQKREQVDPAFNFDFYSSADWFIKPVYDVASRPDHSDLNDAIVDGLSPIASTDSGSFLVYSATTRSKTSGGSVDDARARETHRVSVVDYIADIHHTRSQATFGGFKLKDDERDSNGAVDPNQKLIPKVLTPSIYRRFVSNVIGQNADGLLKNVSDTLASVQTNIDPLNGGRLECGYDLDVINLHHQTTIRIAEVSAG